MKRWIFVGLFMLLLSGAAFFLPHSKNAIRTPAAPPAEITAKPPEDKPLPVEVIVAHPESYKGEIQAQGVVAFVSAKEKTVVLISDKEFAACGVSCPEVFLPVLWGDNLPFVGNRVLVHGKIEPSPKGLRFVARSSKIIENTKNP